MYLVVIVLPLMSGILSGLIGRKVGIMGVQLISVLSMLISSILSTIILYEVGYGGSVVYLKVLDYITIISLNLSWELLYDELSILMMIPVLYVSLMVQLYSIYYMSSDPHPIRFFSYLSLFTFFMLLLITGDNYLVMFVGYEGIGIISYLLISYWYSKVGATRSGLYALTINRIGDYSLTIAYCIIFTLFGTLDYSIINSISYLLNDTIINYITLLLLGGALAKSSQIPLHSWLPGSMEGPTPVSALIHAATLVTAGLYLLLRSSSLLEYSASSLLLITIVGASTALFAAICGLLQYDIKRIIAYSTISQLGYMVLAVGLNHYNIALFHVINHAFFKALLFLSAGAVIHAFYDQQDIRRMGALIHYLPITYSSMIIASITLFALPWTSAFYSKDIIIEVAYANYSLNGTYAYLLSSITAIITAFYSIRLLRYVFFGIPNGTRLNYTTLHYEDWLLATPLLLLSLLAITYGYFYHDLVYSDFFHNAILLLPNHMLLYQLITNHTYLLSIIGCIIACFNFRLLHFTIINYYFNIIIAYYLCYFADKVIDRGVIESINYYGLIYGIANMSIDRIDYYYFTTYALYFITVVVILLFTPFNLLLLILNF